MSRGAARGLAVLLGAWAAATGVAATSSFEARVTQVVDGDTLWVRPVAPDAAGRTSGSGVKVRLHGLDAPERCQAWGAESRSALASRLGAGPVRVEGLGRDDHGRLLARVWHLDEDVGAWLVERGHAWSDGRGHSGGPYAARQRRAREARAGLFAHAAPVRPREFRRLHGPCP